jgi:hypothetical protein
MTSTSGFTTKISLGGNNDVITELFLPKGSLVSNIPAGDGKLVNLFLRCTVQICSIFFLELNTPPFLKRQFCLNRLSSPPDLDPCFGTEDVPIQFIAKVVIIHLILMRNGSAALIPFK